MGRARQRVEYAKGQYVVLTKDDFRAAGGHASALLREAIRESKRIGIAKFILRAHLAAVEAIQDALVLTIMRLEPDVEPRQAEVVDLVERLRRSLQQSAGGKRTAKAHLKRTERKAGSKKRTRHAT